MSRPRASLPTWALTTFALALAALLLWLLLAWNPEVATPAHKPDTARPHLQQLRFTGTEGEVRLADFDGKVVALYFGYTSCPDVCPTSLAELGQALGMLDAATQDKVQGLFISLDPERDTATVAREYAALFHPRLHGLSASGAELSAAAAALGFGFQRQPGTGSGSYTIDHTSATYLIAPDGTLATTLAHGAPAREIAAALQQLAEGRLSAPAR